MNEKNTTVQNTPEFTESEIQYLRAHNLFSHIANQINSTHSQGRQTISSKYVSNVIRELVPGRSVVAQIIQTYAKSLIDKLNLNQYGNESSPR